MQNLQIIVLYDKYGPRFWLADTPTRATRAKESLFHLLDERKYFKDAETDLLEAARKSDSNAITTILMGVEDWNFDNIVLPSDSDDPMDFDIYQVKAHTLSRYPRDAGATYATLGLVGEVAEVIEKHVQIMSEALDACKFAGKAGAIANQVKKIDRDDNGILTEKRRAAILKELGDCLWYIAEVATKLDCPLSQVATNNLNNLFGRKNRGTLHGNGDNR